MSSSAGAMAGRLPGCVPGRMEPLGAPLPCPHKTQTVASACPCSIRAEHVPVHTAVPWDTALGAERGPGRQRLASDPKARRCCPREGPGPLSSQSARGRLSAAVSKQVARGGGVGATCGIWYLPGLSGPGLRLSPGSFTSPYKILFTFALTVSIFPSKSHLSFHFEVRFTIVW